MQRIVLPLILTASLLVGCSSDGGDDEAAPEADTDYCQEILAIQGLGVATNEEAVDLVRELQEVAPDEHQDDLEVILTATRKLAEADPDGTPTPGAIMIEAWSAEEQEAFGEAMGRLTEAAIDDCGFEPDGAPVTEPPVGGGGTTGDTTE